MADKCPRKNKDLPVSSKSSPKGRAGALTIGEHAQALASEVRTFLELVENPGDATFGEVFKRGKSLLEMLGFPVQNRQ